MELWAALESSNTRIVTRVEGDAAWYIAVLETGGYIYTWRAPDGLEGLTISTKMALLERIGEKNARAQDWQPYVLADLFS